MNIRIKILSLVMLAISPLNHSHASNPCNLGALGPLGPSPVKMHFSEMERPLWTLTALLREDALKNSHSMIFHNIELLFDSLSQYLKSPSPIETVSFRGIGARTTSSTRQLGKIIIKKDQLPVARSIKAALEIKASEIVEEVFSDTPSAISTDIGLSFDLVKKLDWADFLDPSQFDQSSDSYKRISRVFLGTHTKIASFEWIKGHLLSKNSKFEPYLLEVEILVVELEKGETFEFFVSSKSFYLKGETTEDLESGGGTDFVFTL